MKAKIGILIIFVISDFVPFAFGSKLNRFKANLQICTRYYFIFGESLEF